MTDAPLKALPIVPPVIAEDVEVIALATYLAEWEEIAREYEADPGDVGHAFLYLAQHPAFWDVREGTDVPYYLMPGSAFYRSIELGVWREARTDKPLVWIEAAPQIWPGDPSLEEQIDANPGFRGGLSAALDTFEESVVALARMVHKEWGNDREFMKLPEEDPEGRWYG